MIQGQALPARLKDLLGHLAGGELAAEDFADQRQREEMGQDQRQDAVLIDLAQLIAVHLAQLLFVDHAEAAIDEGLGGLGRLDRDFAVDQQVHLLQFLDEWRGALGGDLEILAEFQDRGQPSVGFSPSNRGLPSSSSPIRSLVGSKQSDSSSLAGSSRARR